MLLGAVVPGPPRGCIAGGGEITVDSFWSIFHFFENMVFWKNMCVKNICFEKMQNICWTNMLKTHVFLHFGPWVKDLAGFDRR